MKNNQIKLGQEVVTALIHPTEHEKREWSRFARAAYQADRNDIGHRFSGAATLLIGESMSPAHFYALQEEYREWLVFGNFTTGAAK
jgi:hypothetical protein